MHNTNWGLFAFLALSHPTTMQRSFFRGSATWFSSPHSPPAHTNCHLGLLNQWAPFFPPFFILILSHTSRLLTSSLTPLIFWSQPILCSSRGQTCVTNNFWARLSSWLQQRMDEGAVQMSNAFTLIKHNKRNFKKEKEFKALFLVRERWRMCWGFWLPLTNCRCLKKLMGNTSITDQSA